MFIHHLILNNGFFPLDINFYPFISYANDQSIISLQIVVGVWQERNTSQHPPKRAALSGCLLPGRVRCRSLISCPPSGPWTVDGPPPHRSSQPLSCRVHPGPMSPTHCRVHPSPRLGAVLLGSLGSLVQGIFFTSVPRKAAFLSHHSRSHTHPS